jgi:glucose-1-phosphate adenylyltransferase
MGIYVFDARFLFEQLCRDANNPKSSHDFGKDIIPAIIDSQRVFAYRFRDENRKGSAYWRDVGTLDAYYQANMDLISVDPQLNMYDDQWPIRTLQMNAPPVKFVFGSAGDSDRVGHALDSIACNGCIVSGGTVERSVLGPGVRVNSYAQVADSILFDYVKIGRHSKIRRAIIDKGVTVPPGTEIGYDLALDRKRGFTVTESGIVVVAKGEHVEQQAQYAATV